MAQQSSRDLDEFDPEEFVSCRAKGGCIEGGWVEADIPRSPGHKVQYCVNCGRVMGEMHLPDDSNPKSYWKRSLW